MRFDHMFYISQSAFISSQASRLPGSSTESHRSVATAIVLNVISACPGEERHVAPWLLTALVSQPWQSGVQGQAPFQSLSLLLFMSLLI